VLGDRACGFWYNGLVFRAQDSGFKHYLRTHLKEEISEVSGSDPKLIVHDFIRCEKLHVTAAAVRSIATQ
jgi:hypothetical protein